MLTASCQEAGKGSNAEEAPPSIETRWLRPEPASIVSWLDAPARALSTPDASFLVSVPMLARVLRVYVRPGQSVAKDEPLVDVLLPEVLKAAGTLAAATHRIRGYEARRARLGPLVEQGLARSTDLSELEANLALARSEWEAARATLRVANIDETAADRLLSHNGTITLRSPFAAIVLHVAARPGEVREPTSAPLVELMRQGEVQIEARLAIIPPADGTFSWISGNDSVPLVLDAVSPRAAPEDGTRLAWLHATNPMRAPVPGSLGRVRLASAADWFVVPAAAVREQGAQAHVTVRDGQGSKQQAVTVVLRSSSEIIVTGVSRDTQVAAMADEAASEPGRGP